METMTEPLRITNSTHDAIWRSQPNGEVFVIEKDTQDQHITTHVLSQEEALTLMEWLSRATA